MEKKTIRDIDVKGKTVLVRCDFNVPMDENGNILDDTRIKAALPTIQYLMEHGAKVVLCSHLGKPKPKEQSLEEMKANFSLNPVANDLSEKLGKEVKFAEDTTGESAKEMISQLKEGDVGLLENTRFDVRETENDDTLAMEYADLAEVYVNDAYGTAHRAHASTEGVARAMEKQNKEIEKAETSETETQQENEVKPKVKKETAIGFLMEKELEHVEDISNSNERPFVAVLGGAKVSDKLGLITNLIEKLHVDKILIGGKMANTFLKAQGYELGDSGYEEDRLNEAKRIMKLATERGIEIILPTSVRIAKIPAGTKLTAEVVHNAEIKTAFVEDGIEAGWQILDAEEQSAMNYAEGLKGAKRAIWNGTFGVAEYEEFAYGTNTIARIIADEKTECFIGGGDTVSAYNKIVKSAVENGEDIHKFDNIYASTGGGASLTALSGLLLPGVEAIQNKEERTKVGSGENFKTSDKTKVETSIDLPK